MPAQGVVGVVDAVPVEVGVVAGVEPERQGVPAAGRALAGRPPVLLERRRLLAETPDAGIGSEVVIEGPVLLHEQDDVLDVGERSGTRRVGRRVGLVDDRRSPGRQQRTAARGTDPGDELTAGQPREQPLRHDATSRSTPVQHTAGASHPTVSGPLARAEHRRLVSEH